MKRAMIFFVFSFNRGPYLRNCVASLEHCAPDAEVVIFDDRSDDQDTVEALRRIGEKHRVVSSANFGGHRHGGLYSNMQSALEMVDGDRLICFIQDDTQLVRVLDAEDYQFLADCFACNPDLGFISPSFIRGSQLRGGTLDVAHDSATNLFSVRNEKRSAGTYYSDIFLSTSGRLRARGWVFQRGEPANQASAKRMFSAMGYMRHPFVMWLPYGTAFRGKKKTLALRLAERARRCGFYPFEYMADDQVRALKAQPLSELPVAERFLTTREPGLKKPWIYNPLQGSRILKHLNQAELLLNRLLKR
ncbi:MAG TPA: glycosyltransferase family A protein [Burkholderiales bacterium]|nr:glycosyltransferase family A protein [Burkholderiales bacterium]